MRIEALFLLGVAAFFGVVGLFYWFTAYEQGGFVMLVGTTILGSTVLTITPIYEERYDTDIGERVAYEEVAVTGWDSQPIPPGLITDALLCPISGDPALALTVNSFSQISSDEDGDRISINQVPDDLMATERRRRMCSAR